MSSVPSLNPSAGQSSSPMRVLVYWQPDATGREAISTAAWLAQSVDIQVRAVSTVLRLWPTPPRFEKVLHSESERYREVVEDSFVKAGIPRSCWDPEPAIVCDGPSESLLLNSCAEDFGADLVIVGSDTDAAKGRFMANSTADALLHSASTPLALIPRSVKLSKRGITRVNVAYLNAESAEDTAALRYASELADRLEVPLRLVAFSPTKMTHQILNKKFKVTTELTEQWSGIALGLLDRARDTVMATLPELEVTTTIGSGPGWRGAIAELKWKKGDLLCLASTASGPLERVFFGSTEAQFVQHVPVPVIIHPLVEQAQEVQ